MSSSVKGILKGLRYISQIFENEKEEEDEDEIQIGMPTDVKHVAHIGNEGPSTNAPSWMNDYQQGGSETGGGAESDEAKSNGKAKSSSKDVSDSGKTKAKRHGHKNSNGSIGSPAREANTKSRRNKNTNMNTSVAMESPCREVPKSSRPKKSKAGSGGTNSKTKPQTTDNFAASPGRGYEMDMYQKSAS